MIKYWTKIELKTRSKLAIPMGDLPGILPEEAKEAVLLSSGGEGRLEIDDLRLLKNAVVFLEEYRRHVTYFDKNKKETLFKIAHAYPLALLSVLNPTKEFNMTSAWGTGPYTQGYNMVKRKGGLASTDPELKIEKEGINNMRLVVDGSVIRPVALCENCENSLNHIATRDCFPFVVCDHYQTLIEALPADYMQLKMDTDHFPEGTFRKISSIINRRVGEHTTFDTLHLPPLEDEGKLLPAQRAARTKKHKINCCEQCLRTEVGRECYDMYRGRWSSEPGADEAPLCSGPFKYHHFDHLACRAEPWVADVLQQSGNEAVWAKSLHATFKYKRTPFIISHPAYKKDTNTTMRRSQYYSRSAKRFREIVWSAAELRLPEDKRPNRMVCVQNTVFPFPSVYISYDYFCELQHQQRVEAWADLPTELAKRIVDNVGLLSILALFSINNVGRHRDTISSFTYSTDRLCTFSFVGREDDTKLLFDAQMSNGTAHNERFGNILQVVGYRNIEPFIKKTDFKENVLFQKLLHNFKGIKRTKEFLYDFACYYAHQPEIAELSRKELLEKLREYRKIHKRVGERSDVANGKG